jgi:hypothetical protein
MRHIAIEKILTQKAIKKTIKSIPQVKESRKIQK